jgi:hypothetical protein
MCEWATTGMISSRQETRRGEWEASERSVVQCSAVRSALSLSAFIREAGRAVTRALAAAARARGGWAALLLWCLRSHSLAL